MEVKRKIQTYGGYFEAFMGTQKTPTNEIENALKIKEAYYADKQSSGI